VPKLTNELIETIVAQGVERTVFDSATPGFGFRLTANRTGLWIVRARSGDHRVKTTIGTYPEKKLSAARAEAHAALRDIREGKDPRAEKAARKAAVAAGKTTVSELADRWLAEYVRLELKPRTISDYERIIADRIKPRFGALPVASITKSDVIARHDGEHTSAGELHHRHVSCPDDVRGGCRAAPDKLQSGEKAEDVSGGNAGALSVGAGDRQGR
jgi:Arm DNA-binding domain/Phage integrase, N-terminal SAM-like domain